MTHDLLVDAQPTGNVRRKVLQALTAPTVDFRITQTGDFRVTQIADDRIVQDDH